MPPLISDENRSGCHASHSRWLIGTITLGIVATGLLAGALSLTIGQDATSDEPAKRTSAGPDHQVVVDEGRGDPDRQSDRSGLAHSTVRFEQLNDTGSVQSYTRMTARLAESIAAERLANIDHRSSQIDDRPNSDSGLPPIILFGESSPSLPPAASAYAVEKTGGRDGGLDHSLNETTIPESVAPREAHQHVVIARPDDTLLKILSALRVRADEQSGVLSAFARHRRIAKGRFSGGEIVTVIQDLGEADVLFAHVLKVIVSKPGGRVAAVARSDAGRYEPLADAEPDAAHGSDLSQRGIDEKDAVSGVVLRDGLAAIVRSNHLGSAAIEDVMRICGRDFDLDRPLGMRDAASVLDAPDKSGQPEIVFIGLTAQGRTRRYYRFRTNDDDVADFYDEHGRSFGEQLLNSPAVEGHLGDGFGWRIHPILHERRFHQGVDYAAPYGSPILAAGAGMVTVIGRKPGYGLFIRIQHDAGHETTYAHIAGVPSGLKIGDHVRQGETIAYVGSTGLSTGPHLYYEVWVDGQRVDPLRVRSVGGHALRGEEAQSFRQFTQRIDELIEIPLDDSAASR